MAVQAFGKTVHCKDCFIQPQGCSTVVSGINDPLPCLVMEDLSLSSRATGVMYTHKETLCYI